jgi:hypothetical protein
MHPLALLAFFAAAAEPLGDAGTRGTVAVAVDTGSLPPPMANDVQEGVVAHIISGLSQVLLARSATEVELTPVTDAATLDRVLACESTPCLRDLARSAGLALVVQMRVRPAPGAKQAARRARSDCRIALVAVQPSPDHEERTEETECRGCGSAEIKHAASLLASLIAEHITIPPAPRPDSGDEAERAPLTVPPAPPLPAPSPQPIPAPALVVPPAAHPSPPVSPYLSMAAVAGGALLVGTGLYLLHLDGEGSCDLSGPSELCPRRYKTRVPGIALVAGGGAAALSGLVGLLFLSRGRASTRVAFNLSATSLVLSGGF